MTHHTGVTAGTLILVADGSSHHLARGLARLMRRTLRATMFPVSVILLLIGGNCVPPTALPPTSLSVLREGSGDGTVSVAWSVDSESGPAGVCPDECSFGWGAGVFVELVATPNPGSRFVFWSSPSHNQDPPQHTLICVGGESAISFMVDGFNFVCVANFARALTITSVSPPQGRTEGGNDVTIVGTNFDPVTPGSSVTFGGAPATVISVTPTEILATTPTHPYGPADVTVTNPQGGSATVSNAFNFVQVQVSPTTATVVAGETATFDVTVNGDPTSSGATVTIASTTGPATGSVSPSPVGQGTNTGTVTYTAASDPSPTPYDVIMRIESDGPASDPRASFDILVQVNPAAPTGPVIMIYDDVEFGFNGDHFVLAPGNTRALVSPRTGTGTYEVNLENLSNVFVSGNHPNMCTGAPVVADDPVVGRIVLVFGIETTQGCLTQYPPLDFAVGFFNVGSSTGDVATFNGLGQYARAAFSIGALHIQTVGAAGSTNVMLAQGTVCPRYLGIVGTTAVVTAENGTPGTSTEACAATAGVYRVDLSTGTVTGSLLIGDGLRGLALTADGATAYVSDYVGNAVHVIDAVTMQLIRSIPLAGGVVDVALSDDETLLLAALFDTDELALVDLAADQILNAVPARGVSPTRFKPLGNNRFVVLDFGDPGSGVPSRLETVGIIQP